MSEKPWWYPTLVDHDWCERLRRDYPDDASLSDEALKDKYNENGGKYAITWDHIGDAYAEYEKLADAFLKLKNRKAQP